MRALVVGAGAIGRVVTLHLARGGANVSALVKPHQAAAARAGFRVVQRHRVVADQLHWVRFSTVLISTADVAAADWDVVFLCVASPALADRAWLAALAGATGAATVVVVQPGLDDARRVATGFGEARTVTGAMSLMAWAGDELADTEYWVPPLAAIPLSGPVARATVVATSLRRGGLAARVVRDAGAVAAVGAAVLEAAAAGLACAGGRRALAADRRLGRLTAAAAREAMAVIAGASGRPAPAAARLFGPNLGPRAIDALLVGLAGVAPIAPDRFFALHYAKLAAQSRDTLATWSARATTLGLASGALDDLRGRLDEVRGEV